MTRAILRRHGLAVKKRVDKKRVERCGCETEGGAAGGRGSLERKTEPRAP
jgi:hypothetical protein